MKEKKDLTFFSVLLKIKWRYQIKKIKYRELGMWIGFLFFWKTQSLIREVKIFYKIDSFSLCVGRWTDE